MKSVSNFPTFTILLYIIIALLMLLVMPVFSQASRIAEAQDLCYDGQYVKTDNWQTDGINSGHI